MKPTIDTDFGRTRWPDDRREHVLGWALAELDLRGRVMSAPFAAVGIAAGIGALVGLVVPRPGTAPRLPGSVARAVSAATTRVIREIVLHQLAPAAWGYVAERRPHSDGHGEAPRQAAQGDPRDAPEA